MLYSFALYFCLTFTSLILSNPLHFELLPVDATTYKLSIELPVQEGDLIYEEHLSIDADNPQITLSAWHTSTPVVAVFDPIFNQSKKAFDTTVTLEMEVTAQDYQEIGKTKLHIYYYLKSQQKIVQDIISLAPQTPAPDTTLETAIDIPASSSQESAAVPVSESQPITRNASWSSWISDSMEKTQSLPLRLLLVFLLGIFMSLTPCIYPMIPITAGILQSQASRSLLTSFFLALSYATGIATTFALLGLLAAFAGQAMGQFMNHPYFIIPLVGLLLYLAFSMMGFYEMYIPRFMQPRSHTMNSGSFLSAFAFGAVSGIVASPCLSPGLVSLLFIVTTTGSALLGFVLLFSFGMGLSIPLLIIGTFSSALTVLPRAGMWMVEIKAIFGYLMIGMCLYFLKNVIAPFYMNWLYLLIMGALSILFLYKSGHIHSRFWSFLYSCLGILGIAATVLLGVHTTFFTLSPMHHEEADASIWHTDLEQARARARQQNTPLFIDIGASFCSICKAIDATLFADSEVKNTLQAVTIPVKIDGSDAQHKKLLQQYSVIGFPTVLLIDPATETVIKKWGPELYGTNPVDFVNELKGLSTPAQFME